ncbi:MAG: hypothetical protein KAG97_09575, partial [Victivallales bacterium]|nr:hypothetical protein [Victivallales bacterium]
PDYIYAEYFEELLKEKDILAYDADGKPDTYGPQEWRKSVCLHKPDAIEMFKADIKRAIVDLGVDALHFDGYIVGHMETRGACRCATCCRDFTEFLVRRYGSDPETCRRRFGHSHPEAIKPPGMKFKPAMPSGAVTDPAWQEWIIFRCTWTARIARLISEYVYELDPNVVIMTNSGVAVKENLPLLIGNTPDIIGEYSDVIMNEDAYGPYITVEGRVIQRVRQHKMVHGAGAWLWNYSGSNATSLDVGMAHGAAFNKGRLTCIGTICGDDSAIIKDYSKKQAFTRWLDEHWDIFQGLEEVAEIAVWREAKAMAFADPLTYATAMGVEQLLVEGRVPFTVTATAWPSTTKVLILPNLTCLGVEQCEKIVRFVNDGGSVLVIGATSLQDGWGRKFTDYQLRPILPDVVEPPTAGVASQHVAAANIPVEGGSFASVGGDLSRAEVGAGRVGYISSIVDKDDLPSLFNPDHTADMGLDTSYWRVPEKAREIRGMIAWLARESNMFTVEAPRGVIANYYYQEHACTYFVHLVNVTGEAVSETVVKAVLPRGEYSVESMSPFCGDGDLLSWSQNDDSFEIILGSLKTYAIVAIAKKK